MDDTGCSDGARGVTGRMAVGTTGMIGLLATCDLICGTGNGMTDGFDDTGLATFVGMLYLEVGARSSEGWRDERVDAISVRVIVGAAVENERPPSEHARSER